MNNEIKEIIKETKKLVDNSDYKNCYNYHIFFKVEHIAKLLDYITNLQEKYDKALTDLVHESHKRIEIENKITNLQQENADNINRIHELEEEIDKEYVEKVYYKAIRDKTVEYLETRIDSSKAGKWELLNILNGRSDE